MDRRVYLVGIDSQSQIHTPRSVFAVLLPAHQMEAPVLVLVLVLELVPLPQLAAPRSTLDRSPLFVRNSQGCSPLLVYSSLRLALLMVVRPALVRCCHRIIH
jgi:hypothetical protein